MNFLSSSEDEEEELRVGYGKRKKVFRTRINYFAFEEHEFIQRFRLRPTEAELVLQRIGNDLKHRTSRNNALSPQQELLTDLHWLSNGSQYHAISDTHGIGTATVCRAVNKVIGAIISNMFHEYVRWPNDAGSIAQQFMDKGGFPMACGAVDGAIIRIMAPTEYEEQFVDTHGSHSLNYMMIAGPDYTFYAVNARFPGSVHDARVLRSSAIYEKFETGWRPFRGAVVLGDSAYGLSNWIIPPLRRNPNCPVETQFNIAHRRTRRLVENSFGMLENRFPCLRYLRVKPETAGKIAMACAVLHNIESKQDFPDEFEHLEEEVILPENVRADVNGKIQELLNFFR